MKSMFARMPKFFLLVCVVTLGFATMIAQQSVELNEKDTQDITTEAYIWVSVSYYGYDATCDDKRG